MVFGCDQWERFFRNLHLENLQQPAQEQSIHCYLQALALASLFLIGALAKLVLLALSILDPSPELLAAG